ncbi:MAG: phage tail tape measure protein [Oscillospiraceae bacterium]
MAGDGRVVIEIGGDAKPLEKALTTAEADTSKAASAISDSLSETMKRAETGTNEAINAMCEAINTMCEKLENSISTTSSAAQNIEKELSNAFKNPQTEVNNLNNSVSKTSTVFSKVKSVALSAANAICAGFKAVGTAVTAASGAITALGGLAVNVGKSYENSVNKVASIADTTVASIAELSSRVKEMSLDTGTAAEELNEALYQTISATGDTANALDLVSAAVKAAKGGFTDTTTAVDGLTTVLNAYGMAASEAESLANKFLVTQNKGKTTFGELASSIGNVVPTASAAGVSVDELLSAVAALTANGINTASAMTGLKAALSNIITPSDSAAKAAKQMGIDFSASALKAKGLSGFMADIQAATNGDSEAMAQLFGSVEALNSVLVLTGNGSKLFNETLDEMAVNSTALDDAYSVMTKSLDTSLAKLKNSAKVFGINFYESVSEPLSDVVTLANGYINKLSEAFEEGGVTALSKSIGNVLGEAVANYLPDIVSVGSDVITSLAEGLNENADIIMSSAETVFITLVDTISNMTPTLAQTAEKMLVSFGDFLARNTYSVTNAAFGIITTIANGITGALPKLIPAAMECITSLAAALLDNVDELLNCATDIIEALCDGLVDAVPIFIERAPEILLGLASALINAAATAFIDVPVTIATEIAEGLIGYNWNDTAEVTMKNLASAYDKAVDSVADKLTRTGEKLNAFLSIDTSPDRESSELYIGKTKSELEEMISETSDALEKYQAAMKELSSEEVGYDPTKLSQETYNALAEEFGADRMGKIDLLLDKNIEYLKSKKTAMLEAWQELFEAERETYTYKSNMPESSAIADYYNKNGKKNEEALQNFLNGIEGTADSISDAGKTAETKIGDTAEDLEDEMEKFYEDLQYRLARGWIDEDEVKSRLRTKLESDAKYSSAEYTRYWQIIAENDKKAAEETSKKHSELTSIISEVENLSASLNKADTFSVTSETNKRSGDVTKTYGISDYGKKVEARKTLLERIKSLADKGVPKSMLQELIGLDPEEALIFANQLDRLGADELNGLTSDYAEFEKLGNEIAAEVTASGYDDFVEAGKSYAEALAEGINANQNAIQEALFNALPEFRELLDNAVSTKQASVSTAAVSSTSVSSGSSVPSSSVQGRTGSAGTLSAVIPIDITLTMDGKEVAKVVTEQQKNIDIEGGN